MKKRSHFIFASTLALTLALPGLAFAFDPVATATRLKALKLTIRNAPMAQPATVGACVFTGAPGVEEVLVARAY